MDSSKVFGGAEECHSCESGWTMYIGDDPDDDGDDAATDNGDGDDDGRSDGMMNSNHKDESDDSMASDASSGPSHHYGTREAHDFKPTKEGAEGFGSDKKAKRRMEKQKAEMKREEKDQEVMFMAKRVSAPAQSDSKPHHKIVAGNAGLAWAASYNYYA